jgi:site-specific recombinase XerD
VNRELRFTTRHSASSYGDGIDLEHLRLLMGHSDLETTQQYLAVVEDEQYSPLKC